MALSFNGRWQKKQIYLVSRIVNTQEAFGELSDYQLLH